MFELIPISYSQLSSTQGMVAFFEANKPKFIKHYDASLFIDCIDGKYSFLLTNLKIPHDYSTTDTILDVWCSLLQSSSVFGSMKNAALYGSKQPPFLNWLSYSTNSDKLMAQYELPNYLCVMSTFFYAVNKEFDLRDLNLDAWQASFSLDLDAPKMPNLHQLEYILYTFVDTIEADLFWPSSNKALPKKRGHSYSSKQDVDLYLRVSPSVTSYSISLWHEIYSQRIRIKTIDRRMKALEKTGEPMQFADSLTVLASTKPIHCSDISEHLVCLQLLSSENTFDSIEEPAFLYAQFEKMQRKQAQKTSYIPNDDQLLSIAPDNSVLQFIRNNAAFLHEIPQSYIAQWFVEEDIRVVNAAIFLMLGKIQDDKLFTLPGSRDVIDAMQYILAYLQGSNSASLGLQEQEQILLAFLDMESLKLLRDARCGMQPHLMEEINVLYQCTLALSDMEQISSVRQMLSAQYKIAFSDKHNTPYAAKETLYVMIRTLHLLTHIYTCSGQRIYQQAKNYYKKFDAWIEKVLNSPEHLLNAGVFVQFNLQEYLSIDHFILTWGLPVNLLGVTFQKNNKHDGANMSCDILWAHDCYDHPFTFNTIIDSPLKLHIIEERLLFTQHVKQILLKLSQSVQVYGFCNEQVDSKKLLLVFKGLLFMLLHESAFGTHTRTLVLPSSFSAAFWEKQLQFFHTVNLDTTLILCNLYEDFPQELKELLPINRQSPIPLRLAVMLFDVFVKHMQTTYECNEEFNVDDVMLAFQDSMKMQEKYIKLLVQEKYWVNLLSEGIVPSNYTSLFEQQSDACSCSSYNAAPSSYAELSEEERRILLLNLPQYQGRLSMSILPWNLEEDAVARRLEG